ncbi:cytochrome c [Rhabdobacter roseus]|uniref:Cytochrome c n=1 Tax=Rhabdobacter roseus TaxID=1655419 RepID=A0A840TQ18_9BACT|nr:cytochrome c [Rhabdobacter roseus]
MLKLPKYLFFAALPAAVVCSGPLAGSKARQGVLSMPTHQDTLRYPRTFGLGRVVSQEEIRKLDIDVRPDGLGLPPGSGQAAEGKLLYARKCAVCHGEGGVGGPSGSLVTSTTATAPSPQRRTEKTIGTYWPYATTVFDYIRRAMPFNEPGSLSNQEVYQLTAYLLHANGVIGEQTVMDAESLPRVVMPARERFVSDDRQGGPEIK